MVLVMFSFYLQPSSWRSVCLKLTLDGATDHIRRRRSWFPISAQYYFVSRSIRSIQKLLGTRGRRVTADVRLWPLEAHRTLSRPSISWQPFCVVICLVFKISSVTFQCSLTLLTLMKSFLCSQTSSVLWLVKRWRDVIPFTASYK